MTEKIGLICKGRGTRVTYTCEVLQCFLDYDIEFPYTVGTSIDAEVLLPFVAKWRDRLCVTGVDAVCESGAIGVSPPIHEKGVFDIGYVCKFIEKHTPLDYEAFMNNKTLPDIGIYNMDTDEVEYFPKEYSDPEEQILIQASCALLLPTRLHKFHRHMYMDVGLVDTIPIEQGIRQGNTKHMFISAKEENYVRKPAPRWRIQLAKLMYPGNKTIRENLKIRRINYQEQWQIVRELEEQGNAIVPHLSTDYEVTRYTHDEELLGCWFDLGYKGTKNRLDVVRELMEE